VAGPKSLRPQIPLVALRQHADDCVLAYLERVALAFATCVITWPHATWQQLDVAPVPVGKYLVSIQARM